MFAWPVTVPAVAQVVRDGLDLTPGITMLTGENGSGKSTLVEVIAEACELNPQGGSGKAQYGTRDSEPRIGQHLWAERGPAYPSWAYFLRADTMHGLYTYLEQNPGRRPERFHDQGEGRGGARPEGGGAIESPVQFGSLLNHCRGMRGREGRNDEAHWARACSQDRDG